MYLKCQHGDDSILAQKMVPRLLSKIKQAICFIHLSHNDAVTKFMTSRISGRKRLHASLLYTEVCNKSVNIGV